MASARDSEAPGPTSGMEEKGHQGLLFTVVCTAMMMASIDQTIVSTALPTLRHSLNTSISWTGWTITIYQLGLVVALPVAGRMSDQFGRKRVFLSSLAIFVISSLLCAASGNIFMLVAFRFTQALGGGGFMPSASGIIVDHFGRNRDRAIGMLSSTVPVGSMIGPIIGGLIVAYWSWRYVFLVNIPFGVGILLLAIKIVPHSRTKEVVAPDFLGVFFLVAVVLPMMFGITALSYRGVSPLSPSFYISESVAAIFLFAMIRHSRKVVSPLIPIHLLRLPAFARINTINFLYGGCVLGFAALVPLYAEERYHFKPLEAGTLLTSRAIGTLLIAAATAFAIRRIGYRLPMLVGFGLAAIGLFLLAMTPIVLGVYAWLVFSSTIMGLGNGIASPSTNNALYSLADPSEIASIAGLRGMFRQVGAIVVISITTAFVTRSAQPGMVLAIAFTVFAGIIIVLVLPLVLLVPDHKGSW
jgi:EmrB/QacA subfamily drug resistance transporter